MFLPDIELCLKILSNNGIGPVKFFNLINKYQSDAIHYISDIDVTHIINDCHVNNITIIPYYSELYPANLLKIQNYPPVLFAKGNIELLHKSSLAIVGSRDPSVIGLKVAHDWSKELSASFTIISGLARGIDWAVAEGATVSVGVLASGILVNNKVNTIVNNNGLVVSEFFPRTVAKLSSFAMRNRMISGMSNSVLIVEAGIKSGTMRTAKMALLHKRPIFVIPGHPLDIHYEGNNFLIQNEKVYVALTTADILGKVQCHMKPLAEVPTTNEEKLYSLLSTVPVYIEEIAYLMKLPLKETQLIVSNLELQNYNIHVSYDGKISIT